MIARALALMALVAMVPSCGHGGAPGATDTSLGGDVARVGDTAIPVALVAQVSAVRGLAPRSTLDLLVDDALAAQGARARGLDREPAIVWATTGALARREVARLAEEARSLGPPSDDELATLGVVHAVVMHSAALTEVRARATIAAVRKAVLAARTPEEFESLALAVPHQGMRMVAQPVSGLRADGHEFDANFVAAAFALRSIAETSPIVETSFGWHVIRLVERVPPDPAQAEPRRREIADSVQAMRTRGRVGLVLEEARERMSVELTPAAEGLMSQVAARQP